MKKAIASGRQLVVLRCPALPWMAIRYPPKHFVSNWMNKAAKCRRPQKVNLKLVHSTVIFVSMLVMEEFLS